MVEHTLRHMAVELIDDVAPMAMPEHEIGPLQNGNVRRQRVLPHLQFLRQPPGRPARFLPSQQLHNREAYRVGERCKGARDVSLIHISRIVDMNDS